MTANPWLDAIALAISLHNTILLLWLGLTVLLNADRRNWGIWLTGISLLSASGFFFSHSAILALGVDLSDVGLDFWWHFGWLPVIVLPYGWYLVILWYAGAFDRGSSLLRYSQNLWFYLVTTLTFSLLALFIFGNPLPSFVEITNLRFAPVQELNGVPILAFVYALNILLCIALSIDALVRPGPSKRAMGAIARRRARPWLIVAAVMLLSVGIAVAAVISLVVTSVRDGIPIERSMTTVGVFDLIIASLIGVGIILIGQAIALYEVFTGRILPRRGLLRQWHDAVILALGFSVVASASLTLRLHPIYIIFLAVTLITVFYALYAWRSYREHDQYIRDLRPFVTSQHLYDQLLRGSSDSIDVDAQNHFHALCLNVLNSRGAFLIPVGPLAPFVPTLVHSDASSEIPSLPQIQFESSQITCKALDPDKCNGMHWAVPLWSERGLSGVLMLGEKQGGGVYAQEEFEIAAASGERLIDTIATAELSRRLMLIQRQKLAETQLLDSRSHHVLHDEVLPQLHAALLTLENSKEIAPLLSHAHRQISDLLRDTIPLDNSQVQRLGLIDALRTSVETESSEAFDRVSWEVGADVEAEFKTLSPTIAETLFFAAREAIRNAGRHARVAGRALGLKIAARIDGSYEICIEDDGVGRGTTQNQAGGQGLAFHGAMMAIVGGSLAVEPKSNGGTLVTIALPLQRVEKS